VYAQIEDFGLWADLSVSKSVRAEIFSFNSEFYTKGNSRALERISIGLEENHRINQHLKIGTGYLLMNYNLPNKLELRHRFYSGVGFKWHYKDFEINQRERVQLTLKPGAERNLIKEFYWRNLFQVEYKINSSRISPSASFESFCPFHRADGNLFDEFRYSLGMKYSILSSQSLKLYGLYSETKVKNLYIIGIDYSITI
jgi:hypothetical protein